MSCAERVPRCPHTHARTARLLLEPFLGSLLEQLLSGIAEKAGAGGSEAGSLL